MTFCVCQNKADFALLILIADTTAMMKTIEPTNHFGACLIYLLAKLIRTRPQTVLHSALLNTRIVLMGSSWVPDGS